MQSSNVRSKFFYVLVTLLFTHRRNRFFNVENTPLGRIEISFEDSTLRQRYYNIYKHIS